MKILVVGGGGYIGCHMVDNLLTHGHAVTVLDDLSAGHQEFMQNAVFVRGDCGDANLLEQLFTQTQFDAVMHFAALIQVSESVKLPEKYYDNNVNKTLILLNSMRKYNIKNLVFSSSAAVFGNPLYVPIDEEHPKNPINPYGRTKWMVEQILQDYQTAYELRSVSLRYFNAAGADPLTRFGECHDPETHLIPLLLQAASARKKAFQLFGDDYPTLDGTAIRDYIHVTDIAEAHFLALEHLLTSRQIAPAYNLGNGKGHSVKEVIDTVQKITAQKLTIETKPRRIGDPSQLIANSTKIFADLGWRPRHSDLANIIESAWKWELKRFSRS